MIWHVASDRADYVVATDTAEAAQRLSRRAMERREKVLFVETKVSKDRRRVPGKGKINESTYSH
jgi:hypothetical protein